MAAAAYFSFHSSLPLPASRHRMTSSPSCRPKTYSFSRTSTGEASPRPTLTRHFFISSLGHVVGALKLVTLLSRFGPRHCGQSWPLTRPAPSNRQKPTSTCVLGFPVFIVALLWVAPHFAIAVSS